MQIVPIIKKYSYSMYLLLNTLIFQYRKSNSFYSIIYILLVTRHVYTETDIRRFSSISHVQKFGTPSKSYTKVNQQISIHSEEIHSTAIPKFFGSSPATADDSSRIPNFPRCKTRVASASGASTWRPGYFAIKMHPANTASSLADSVRRCTSFLTSQRVLNQIKKILSRTNFILTHCLSSWSHFNFIFYYLDIKS